MINYDCRGRLRLNKPTKIAVLCDKIFKECSPDVNFDIPEKRLVMAIITRSCLDINDKKRVDPLDFDSARYYLDNILYLHLQLLEVDEVYFREQFEKHGFDL